MNIPYFSIIIPLFNKEKYIVNTINSILHQDFNDFEIIIVDDGSTDASLEKIKYFLSDKVSLIEHDKNKGLSATRNTGIKNAKANYIAFIDADDTWLPHYLKTIKYLIDTFIEARIYAANMQYVYPKQTIAIDNKLIDFPSDYKGYINFFKENLKQGLYCINTVCYHKSVFEKVGYFDEKITFSEEIDFYIRSHLKFKFAYDTTVCSNYYMEIQNQLSQSNIANKIVPNYDLYDSYCETVPYFKKFLDIQRYILAKNLKMNGDKTRHRKILKNIDFSNLNLKQQILLKVPIYLLKKISKFKQLLVKNGISWTSYTS